MNGPFDAALIVLSAADAKGESIHANPHWLAYTGQTESEALGYGWLKAVHADDRPGLIETLSDALARRAEARCEFRVRRHDGVYRWALVVGAPRYDGRGAFIGYLASLIETERSREIEQSLRVSEAELRLAHERLTATLRASPVVVFEQRGPDLRHAWILNPTPGMLADAVVGCTDHDLFLPDDADKLTAIKRRALATRAPVREEVSAVIGGETRWYDLSVEPHGEGADAGVLCTATDITDRKRADMALHRAQATLALAVDAAQMATWEIDLSTGVVSRNLRHDQIFGYEDLQENWTLDDLRRHVVEEDRVALEAGLENAVRTGVFDIDVQIRRADGALRWLAIRGRHTPGPATRAARAAGVCYDVTERKAAEQAREEADRRKNEFIAILGHELRNPLAPILNGVEALRRWLPAEASGEERALLDMMQRQTAYLVRLVDDLLELSRVNSGVIELRRERADLRLAVRDALETAQPLIAKKGHEVVTRLAAEPAIVFGDPMRLAQIVANLVGNAAKYTAPGGRIDIETERRGDRAAVIVRDNGVGIAPEALPKAFDLFTQINPPGMREGGLGVGLALARKLAELHGGAIEARSAGLGEGAEFVVTLPLAPEADRACAAPAAEPADAPGAREPQRLLVVDDNHDVADSMAMLLESFGASVRVAYDGASGVAAAAEFWPEIAFIDIRMPGVDGYETARLLRARLGARAPKLVALTGLGQESDREGSRDAGFDLHLTKPVPIDALESLLRTSAAG